jgi:hypothetical protein
MRKLPVASQLTDYLLHALGASAIVFVWLFAGSLAAQEELERPPPIPPEAGADVPIPPKIQDEQLEPTVTIREEEERTIEEYRFNGQVYMVKITPKGGIPYYYIDTDGDGKLELDADKQALNPVQPVYWKVKEWQ